MAEKTPGEIGSEAFFGLPFGTPTKNRWEAAARAVALALVERIAACLETVHDGSAFVYAALIRGEFGVQAKGRHSMSDVPIGYMDEKGRWHNYKTGREPFPNGLEKSLSETPEDWPMNDVPIPTKEERKRMRERAANTSPYLAHPQDFIFVCQDIRTLLAALEQREKELEDLRSADNYVMSIGASLEKKNDELQDKLVLADAQRDALAEGLTCFSCGISWSPTTSKETCDQSHRQTWGHEWVSDRVKKLTQQLFHVTTQCDALAEALRGAVEAIEQLADQQAMPDDSYMPHLSRARAVLAGLGKENAGAKLPQ
jgi:hypothetical protein